MERVQFSIFAWGAAWRSSALGYRIDLAEQARMRWVAGCLPVTAVLASGRAAALCIRELFCTGVEAVKVQEPLFATAEESYYVRFEFHSTCLEQSTPPHN